jgi:hypothetical protein
LTARFVGLSDGGIGNQLFEIMTIYGIVRIVKKQLFIECLTSKNNNNAPKDLYVIVSVGIVMQVELFNTSI